ncbi:MAG: hypothetical protein IPG80_05935 [Anaerolineales bacterium]|uniref:formylglycine-generating enzyme family protein n=1 Tax=Candidatus Villigracilis vicinus TaxID=3140679 RepID=UPI0031359E12|nr:hypothetical protein [Anaerolineales bacterium]
MDYDITEYPRVYHGLCHLPEARLIEIANKAGASLKSIKPGLYGQIVESILKHIESFDELKTLLTPKDFDIIGQKNSIGDRKTWNRPYLDYDHAVFVDMTRKSYGVVQRPVRTSARNASHADLWLELASLKAWSKLEASQKTKVAKSLARSLGDGFTFVDLVGPHELMRFQHTAFKLHFIAIPGGKYSMGLTDDEKKELTRLAKKHGIEEAKYFARDIAETARPAHEVKLPPFLCAQTPITGAQGKKFTKSAELLESNHNIYWYGAKAALQLTEQSATRLPTEAEWEYIARAGAVRTWLNGEEDPQEYTSRILSAKLLEDDHPFGVCGLGWGTWVEDGWHLGYKNAPVDGSAWEPRDVPNVVRSGGFLSHPWQTPGEEFMLHCTYREQVKDREYPVLLAKDLPKRKK